MKFHEMSDGGLAFTIIERSHGSLLGHLIIVCQLCPSTCLVFVAEWLLVSCLRNMTRSRPQPKATRAVASFGGCFVCTRRESGGVCGRRRRRCGLAGYRIRRGAG